MNYLSVCSGIEAATVAWHHLNWQPTAFSEIEKFPSEVLSHHYPDVPNLGDMTKYKEWKLNDTIGLLVGGTPCQSFSVAGLRKGLEDPRGNLMLTYLGIADRFKPKWILWENVPGVLTSNGGKDFACFLQGLAEVGYGFAYRVLDAQYFGVPQRRKRVFVVGCLGDWRSAAKVLFESESLQGDLTPSRPKREETAEYVADCIGTMLARDYKGLDSYDHTKMIARPVGAIDLSDTSKTLTASYGMGGADLEVKPLILEPQTIPISSQHAIGRVDKDDKIWLGIYNNGDPCPTITKSHSHAVAYEPIALAENTIGRQPHNGGNGNGFTEGGPMYTLNATGVHGIAIDTYNGTVQGDVTATMTASMAGPTNSGPKVMQNMVVRRLTPIECERLQGFPDKYTDIKPKGKDTPDGPRYKALGNSMAVPVMRWIGERINKQEKGNLQ